MLRVNFSVGSVALFVALESCGPSVATLTYGDGGSAGCAQCRTPPANHCVSSTSLSAYDQLGTCATNDGQCLYAPRTLACANGCADGGCIGDPCVGMPCLSPPAAACASSGQVRSYDAGGVCQNGSCLYPSTLIDCAAGEACVQGSCRSGTDGGGSSICGPSTCAGCCAMGQCLGGTALSACGKAGAACATCPSTQQCDLASRSCTSTSDGSRWRVLVTSVTATGSDWDSLDGPDLFVQMYCPATATTASWRSATVENQNTATWATGGCVMTSAELQQTGFAWAVTEADDFFGDDIVAGKTVQKLTSAQLVSGTIPLTVAGAVSQGTVKLTAE